MAGAPRPSPTLLQLAEADGARAVAVELLEEVPPLLDEAQQGREAVHVDAPGAGPVKRVWGAKKKKKGW